jgi:hypothetical protein
MARLRFRIERDGGVGQGYEADYVGAASVFTRGMTLVRSPLGQRLSAGAVSGLSDLRPQELFSRVRLSPGRVRSGILVYTVSSPPPYVRTREYPSKRVLLMAASSGPEDKGDLRLALEYGHGMTKPLRVEPARRSMDGSRRLDRRREEGEAPPGLYGGSLRPPRLPAVHAADPRNRRALGPALAAVVCPRPYGSGTLGHATKCVVSRVPRNMPAEVATWQMRSARRMLTLHPERQETG